MPEEIVKAELQAKIRLSQLETFVRKEFGIEVVPVSAKWGMNLEAVVSRMRRYVEEAENREAGGRNEIHIEQEVHEPLRIHDR